MTTPSASPLPNPGRSSALTGLDSQPVEARSLPTSPASPAQLRADGAHLEELWLPAVTLHAAELEHNLDRFARWCAERGLDLAPHGKTTMAPQLWQAQLDRGAWAITAATAAQARIMYRFGVARILIANEVLDPAAVAWLGAANADPGVTVLCLVDSTDAVERMEQALADAPQPVPVLVELGVAGRRTGVRSLDDALELAGRVARSAHLTLAGVEGYEGVLPQRRDTDAPRQARAWLERLSEFVYRADHAGLFSEHPEVIVTAGGSAYPDLVADAFAQLPAGPGPRQDPNAGTTPEERPREQTRPEPPALSLPLRRVLRSGCYVTHDDLFLERASPLRSGADTEPLRPALSCFARVLSYPEPGRALVGAGKRDVSFDLDLPIVRAIHRAGQRLPVGRGVRLVELNDHHGFLDIDTEHADGTTTTPRIGDVVELGLSHPCTVFDKWPLIPVLDTRHRVIDAVRTLF
ncbi:alanine racemase [Lipingzhangella sp. LS1_29]|uniref:Alanine racemase n=1 Tax=Lipingzhangella rawalii TaxID=2055835 RepID=A0ABU2H8L9_9ACTN|nr:alanine racemase [Lipingzhangella rawalii]MDS1271623.1 alanine racemase [Lipingzhangella rawalii]